MCTIEGSDYKVELTILELILDAEHKLKFGGGWRGEGGRCDVRNYRLKDPG